VACLPSLPRHHKPFLSSLCQRHALPRALTQYFMGRVPHKIQRGNRPSRTCDCQANAVESESAAGCDGGFLLRCAQEALCTVSFADMESKARAKLASHTLYLCDPNVPSGVCPVHQETGNFWASILKRVLRKFWPASALGRFSSSGRTHTHTHTHTHATRADEHLACRGMSTLVHKGGSGGWKERGVREDSNSTAPSFSRP
jgi:hypothetical protein